MTEFENAMLTAINGLQNQMHEMQSDIKGMQSDIKGINGRLDNIEGRLDRIESDIEEIKEDATITRTAANYNGEKLDGLITELQRANIIAWYILCNISKGGWNIPSFL